MNIVRIDFGQLVRTEAIRLGAYGLYRTARQWSRIAARRRTPSTLPSSKPDQLGWSWLCFDSGHPHYGAIGPQSGRWWDKVLFRHPSGWEVQFDRDDLALLDPDLYCNIEQDRLRRVGGKLRDSLAGKVGQNPWERADRLRGYPERGTYDPNSALIKPVPRRMDAP